MIELRLGLRNLFRNRWRSGLTLAAVAVAVALMVWTVAFMDGWLDEMVKGTTSLETLQAQVHTVEYVRNPRVYRTVELDAATLAELRALPGVAGIAPRAELHGLVGTEQRSQVARMIGVDPAGEAEATPIEATLEDGRWLSPVSPEFPAPRETVLGRGLARQLDVGVGDELVVLLEAADGSLGNDLLEVVGIVRTGNTEIDRGALYLHLKDAQFMAALGDGVHHVAIRAADLTATRTVAEAVATKLGASFGMPGDDAAVAEEALVVRTWHELVPSLYQMIQLMNNSYWVMYLIVYVVAAVGVLNTQRMSAMERRREFGVMMAVGMRPRRMFRTLLVETAVLGTVGAAVGAVLGGAVAWYHAAWGMDLGMFSQGATFTFMGATFSDRLYASLSAGTFMAPILVMIGIAMISGLIPALRAARIDPAPTIAGRT